MAGKGGDNSAEHSAQVTACKQYLQWCRAWELKVHGGMYQREGVPDILCCFPPSGRFLGIEVKTGTGRLSVRQSEELRAIEVAGGVGLVVRDAEDLERQLLEHKVIARALNLSHQAPE